MSTIELRGCHVEPLSSYLKGLGVLRTVGEQLDPSAMSKWQAGAMWLNSTCSSDELVKFFLDGYHPTPVVSPWNGGSGFSPKDRQTGIAAIAGSTNPRLSDYRRAIATGHRLVNRDDWADLEKQQQVQLCRGQLPDSSVRWIDTAIVLTDDRPSFPPLLGTGGNVGRLEFSNNFMQALVRVLGLDDDPKKARTRSEDWLRASLFEEGTPKLVGIPIGQFDPGGAGGANSGPLGDAGSIANPWEFILLFEGALLFASGAARRMAGGATGKAAMPFMVDHSPIGFASAGSGESSRGELWAPLWDQPATLGEVERFMNEGRATWRGAQAGNGLDFGRAVASLGTDRGIRSFVRYAFVERHGQNMLAVPINRIEATRTVRADVLALGDTDIWVRRVRSSKNLPTSIEAALRTLDEAQFAIVDAPGAVAQQDALIALANLEHLVANSRTLRASQVEQPVRWLHASSWLPCIDDGSCELRLAVAFASQHSTRSTSTPGNDRPSPAYYLRAIKPGARYITWADGPTRTPGLGVVSIASLLARFLQQRMIDSGRWTSRDAETESQVGVVPAFDHSIPAYIEDVERFIRREIDDERLSRLISACLLLDFQGAKAPWITRDETGTAADPHAHPFPALDALGPFFSKQPIDAGNRHIRLTADRAWPTLLAAGRTPEVLGAAIQRLRVAKLETLVRNETALSAGLDGLRLCASLTFPISRWATRQQLDRVASLRSATTSTN